MHWQMLETQCRTAEDIGHTDLHFEAYIATLALLNTNYGRQTIMDSNSTQRTLESSNDTPASTTITTSAEQPNGDGHTLTISGPNGDRTLLLSMGKRGAVDDNTLEWIDRRMDIHVSGDEVTVLTHRTRQAIGAEEPSAEPIQQHRGKPARKLAELMIKKAQVALTEHTQIMAAGDTSPEDIRDLVV